MTSPAVQALLQLVVCPVCKGRLHRLPSQLTCSSCGRQFPQQWGDYVDLLPAQMTTEDTSGWSERQQTMSRWYDNLLANPADARGCFASDFTPFAPILGNLHGLILDVGGGIGLVRQYLPEGSYYVVIDPSVDWLGAAWDVLAEPFPCVADPPPFIRGVGEYLPFATGSFDVVLSFWSLNHVMQPQQVLAEMCRVLRSRGTCLLVLEDMTPGWRDLVRPGYLRQVAYDPVRSPRANTARLVRQVLRMDNGLRRSDHIPLREDDIRTWITGCFHLKRRSWTHRYLTLELEKRQCLQQVGVELGNPQTFQRTATTSKPIVGGAFLTSNRDR